jgi:hypothetical protein
MREINLLADKIEQAINKMFAHFAEHNSGMCNYALLFNPKKSEKWLVVLVFSDMAKLKSSLNNGFCYNAYQFLQNELILIDKELPISIRFDSGEYPSNKLEYEQLLEKHTVTFDTLNNEKGQQQICRQCGHDWSKHRLTGLKTEDYPIPMEGWMACPEEECTCFMTWDTPITKRFKK